jgi:hypothetical protein
MTVPVDIDPDTAREAAVRELADPAYEAAEPSWLEQVLDYLDSMFGTVGLGAGSLVGLVILAVALFAVVRLRVGRLARTHRAGQVFAAGRTLSAEDYRQAAEQAHARGDLDTAVRERFRAIVRELERRGVLDERSGWTVDEIAMLAGRRMPGRAGELRAAATLFDDVVYGGHHATDAGYRDLAALDAAIQTERVLATQ